MKKKEDMDNKSKTAFDRIVKETPVYDPKTFKSIPRTRNQLQKHSYSKEFVSKKEK